MKKILTKLALISGFCFVINIQADYAEVLSALGSVPDDAYKTAIMKAVYIQVPEAQKDAALALYFVKANPGVQLDRTAKRNGGANKKNELNNLIPADDEAVKNQFIELMTGKDQPGTALVAASNTTFNA